MAEVRLPGWFEETRGAPCATGKKAARARFLDKTISSVAGVFGLLLRPEPAAEGRGGVGRVTPRARILGVLMLVTAAAVSGSWGFLLCHIGLISILALLSSVNPGRLFKRVLPAFVFTMVIVLPVFFNFVSGGDELIGFGVLGVRVAVTDDGVATALFFLTRVVAMVSAVMLLMLTTREADFFGGLRGLPVPGLFVTAFYMTYRYLFMLLKTVEDAALARRSRTIDAARVRDARGWFASRAVFVLKRSLRTAEDVTMAMISRGFSGRVKASAPSSIRGGDLLWLGAASFILFLSFGF